MRPDPRIAERVRAARLKAGLSQVAAGGGRISAPHLCLIEQAKRGISADRLIFLAGRLGVTLRELLPEGVAPAYLDKLLRVGELLSGSGKHSRAVTVFSDLVPFIPSDRADLAAACQTGLGFALVNMRQYELARPYLDEGLRLAEAAGDPHLVALARSRLGFFYFEQADHRHALTQLEQAHRALRGLRRPWPALLVSVLINLSIALRGLNRPAEALTHLDEAKELAAAANDHVQVGTIARSAAGAYVELRQFDRARERFEEAAGHFTAAERRDLIASAENGLGILLVETGRPEQAIPHFLRAVRLSEQIADDLRRARNLTELARAHVLLGQHETALPYATEAIRLSQKVNDPLEAARAEALRGEILLARHKFREAEAALRYAIPVFERHAQRKDLIQAYAALGRVLNAQDRPAQASAALGQAVALAGVRLPSR